MNGSLLPAMSIFMLLTAFEQPREYLWTKYIESSKQANKGKNEGYFNIQLGIILISFLVNTEINRNCITQQSKR